MGPRRVLETKTYWLTDRQSQYDFDFDYDFYTNPVTGIALLFLIAAEAREQASKEIATGSL
jgi:hypothetical protein